MIKVGIVGGAGYTAGELLRLLIHHPQVEVKSIQSRSHSGQLITNVHRDLIGETNLAFDADLDTEIDVLFLCAGHGKSVEFFAKNSLSDSVKVIDLSADYRIEDSSHEFVYGLPELNKQSIAQAKLIANPGCFATAIELAYLPLAANALLNTEMVVNAITGSTGAGQQPTSTSHFSWKNNNVSVYKAFTHQHLAEIKQSLKQAGATCLDMTFIPVRGNLSRGIMATCIVDSDKEIEELFLIYEKYYADHPFVVVSNANPDVKQVVNTNKCVLHLVKQENKLLIISVIDNLLKGASGQALQNMNLMFGLNETEGLKLKPVGF